ncbi:Lrp/AsnC family transcriptional regulator [Yimella sp. cx-51]|nr:Lrp/AsnC family transcriptional regulator [Yimella sp. cx-51]QTH38935.1 Lrp/AsnC family transcriptional regulator [Yimella sp. cx-51]
MTFYSHPERYILSMLDAIDRRLLRLLHDQPQIGVLGASRALDVARGTVQARLDKLRRKGVIASESPTLAPAALGFPVTAFCTLSIAQRQGYDPVLQHLTGIPEVLEVHTITGDGDLLVRIVGRDNADLQRVIDEALATDAVVRSSTVIALSELVPYRTLGLVDAPS